MKTIIEAGGATIDKVVKTTVREYVAPFSITHAVIDADNSGAQVFLADMNDFAAMNAIYSEFFGGHKPARSAVQVARLPLDGRFEIECIVRYVYALR